MTTMFENAEFADNPEPRCPCLILADTSYSMSGMPIAELNEGIQTLHESLLSDAVASLRVEVGIIAFGGDVREEHPFATVDQFRVPCLDAGGGTPMGEAIDRGLKALKDRKNEYRANGILYYRPWLFLLTDGGPTDEWKAAAARLHKAEADQQVLCFAIGVDGADMKTLTKIAPPSRPPVRLKGLAFAEMFRWVSASLGRMAASQAGSGEQVALPPVDAWAQIGA